MFFLDQLFGRPKLGRKTAIALLTLGLGCNIIGFVSNGALSLSSALPDYFYIAGFVVWALAVLLLRTYYFLTIATVLGAVSLAFIASVPKPLSFLGAGFLVVFAVFCGWRGAFWEGYKNTAQ
jgi:hypothetical protein